jgi:hypothetical protein
VKYVVHLIILPLLVALASLSGCGFLVGTAAGGVAGYQLKERGYEVQPPLRKKKNDEASDLSHGAD